MNTTKPQPVPSRYLKNSTSSCHDHCKSGIKPPFSTIPEKFSDSTMKPFASEKQKFKKNKGKLEPHVTPSNADNITSHLPSSPGDKNMRRSGHQTSNTKSFPSFTAKSRRNVETGTPGSSSKPSKNSSNRFSSDDSADRGFKAKGNVNGLSRFSSRPIYEEKSRLPQKLHFRKGKVVEPKPESSTVRRLQFRNVRVVDESRRVLGDTERRSYLRAEVNAAEVKNNPKSEKILLRHRSLEKRKKNQSLLNNVIEETASRLVQSRKSKVKALVGAFETVISLQDPKPKAINPIS